ncbi:hypothetical protein J6590_074230 [Homalodisca vitripennis]|nr:hypothetical protein J6590_074230 [Homalodisca vitripennis]
MATMKPRTVLHHCVPYESSQRCSINITYGQNVDRSRKGAGGHATIGSAGTPRFTTKEADVCDMNNRPFESRIECSDLERRIRTDLMVRHGWYFEKSKMLATDLDIRLDRYVVSRSHLVARDIRQLHFSLVTTTGHMKTDAIYRNLHLGYFMVSGKKNKARVQDSEPTLGTWPGPDLHAARASGVVEGARGTPEKELTESVNESPRMS